MTVLTEARLHYVLCIDFHVFFPSESEDVVMESEGTSQKNLKKKPRNLKRLKHKRRKKNRR